MSGGPRLRSHATVVVGSVLLCLFSASFGAGNADEPPAATPYPGAAHAIGSAANGCLTGGEALPLSGMGWETLRPERNRFWGHPALIAFLRDVSGGGGLPGRVLVGDLAQPRGGHLASGHGSHQTGLDVDIFYRLGMRPLADEERRQPAMDPVVDDNGRMIASRWGADQQRLVKTFAIDPRVERIFVNPMVKRALCRDAGEDRAWLQVVRPWWGHADHFHVRIRCPDGDETCVAGPPLPPGDGCGGELSSWIDSGDWRSAPKPPAAGTPPAPRKMPPAACQAVFAARP